jgi:hypothetical protein
MSMSKELQRRIEQLSYTVDQLVIVDRQISGDLCATFSLRGPPGSLIGMTCVSALPCHHVAVVGDLCTAVFATWGDEHWCRAVRRFYRQERSGFPCGYVQEKAASGMTDCSVTEFLPEEAKEYLERLFKDDDDEYEKDPENRRYDEFTRGELLGMAENNGEQMLYERMSDIDPDFADGHLPGHVLRRDIIAGALVMNHLSRLLDNEEKAQ